MASVYVPPSETLNELAFDRMIKSFSSRYLVLGDFNGHSYLWGANQENERGKAVEHLIDSHNLILLNDSVHTRFDTYHQTSSLLDLSLCHPSISGRGRRLAGFDAPFNMGSAECKIEWSDNFDATYLKN